MREPSLEESVRRSELFQLIKEKIKKGEMELIHLEWFTKLTPKELNFFLINWKK